MKCLFVHEKVAVLGVKSKKWRPWKIGKTRSNFWIHLHQQMHIQRLYQLMLDLHKNGLPLEFSPLFVPFCEKAALQALKASDWHLEGAFDVFYSQPQVRSFTDSRHLKELHNRYKGKSRRQQIAAGDNNQEAYNRTRGGYAAGYNEAHLGTNFQKLLLANYYN